MVLTKTMARAKTCTSKKPATAKKILQVGQKRLVRKKLQLLLLWHLKKLQLPNQKQHLKRCQVQRVDPPLAAKTLQKEAAKRSCPYLFFQDCFVDMIAP